MRTERSESFKKAYRKLDPAIQKKVDRKLKLFDDRLKQFGSNHREMVNIKGFRLHKDQKDRWWIRIDLFYGVAGKLKGGWKDGTMIWYFIGKHGGTYERHRQR